jgi:hypothetical protein
VLTIHWIAPHGNRAAGQGKTGVKTSREQTRQWQWTVAMQEQCWMSIRIFNWMEQRLPIRTRKSKGLVLVAAFHRPFHMRVDGSMQGQNRTNGPSPGPRSEIVCEHFLTLS